MDGVLDFLQQSPINSAVPVAAPKEAKPPAFVREARPSDARSIRRTFLWTLGVALADVQRGQ